MYLGGVHLIFVLCIQSNVSQTQINRLVFMQTKSEMSAKKNMTMPFFLQILRLLKRNKTKYFKQERYRWHKTNSDSIIVNRERVYELLNLFIQGDIILFAEIDLHLMAEFKRSLISAPHGGNKSGIISLNTDSTYYSIFKALFLDDAMFFAIPLNINA